MSIDLRVPGSEAESRLDRFVSHHLEGVSTRTAARLAAAGAVRVNGRRAPKGRRLREGDHVEVDTGAIEEHAGDFAPEADPSVDVDVLHRDGRTLVADKPAGIHTAPVRKEDGGTLVAGVLALAPETGRVRGFHRREAGLIHRLDRDTSGACLFALDQDAFDRLRTASGSDLVVKDYHAIVEGRVMENPPVLEAAIPPSGARGKRVYVQSVRRISSRTLAPGRTDDGTRLVRMRVEVVDRTVHRSLVRLKLTRGFRHQVRSVLAAIGHPILGDGLYGPGPPDLLMLHASRIVFPHPDDGRLTRVVSPPDRVELQWNRLSGPASI